MTMTNNINIIQVLASNIGCSISISKESPSHNDLLVNINDLVIVDVKVDKWMNIERTYKLTCIVTSSHPDFNIPTGKEIELLYIEKLNAYTEPTYIMNRIGDDRKQNYYFSKESLSRLPV